MEDPSVARPDLSGIDADTDSEVAVLVAALDAYADRLVSFVERERQFTRDASHELRTPLAVFRANLELLVSQIGDRPLIRRMEDTVEDMEATLETLLMLARTEQRQPDNEDVIVNDLAVNLMERLSPLADRKQIRLQVRQTALLTVHSPEVALTIVLTNLVRNAINYSGSGDVTILVAEKPCTWWIMAPVWMRMSWRESSNRSSGGKARKPATVWGWRSYNASVSAITGT